MQVRRRTDPTAVQDGYVKVLWLTRCCARHEKAEKVYKWMKYISSVALSGTLTILCFFLLAHEVRFEAELCLSKREFLTNVRDQSPIIFRNIAAYSESSNEQLNVDIVISFRHSELWCGCCCSFALGHWHWRL